MADAKTTPAPDGDRLAKVIARAGMCSRREAEKWIADGRVSVDGKIVRTPAFNVTGTEKVMVDGEQLAERKGTRVWAYHKPAGLVVTENDPEGRPTIFEKLSEHGLPRVVTVGRLDINTEGLLLLTNDGGLKRVLELPATGWLRKYRVRAFGKVDQSKLDTLKKGMELDGIKYGPIEATLEREQGQNSWLVVALREGKNREVKNVLGALGLQVNRLIRVSYGPFQLGDLPIGAVSLIKSKVLRDQLGDKLSARAGADFESPFPDEEAPSASNPNARLRPRAASKGRPGKPAAKGEGKPRGRTGEPVFAKQRAAGEAPEPRTRTQRGVPERAGNDGRKSGRDFRSGGRPDPTERPKRTVHFDDGRTEDFEPRAKRPRDDERDGDAPARGFGKGPRRDDGPKGKFGGKSGDKPAGKFGGKPSGKFGGKPAGKAGGKPAGKFGGKSEGRPGDRSAGSSRDGKPSGARAPGGPRKPGGKPGPRAGGRPSGPARSGPRRG